MISNMSTVKVYKTNVDERSEATSILDDIREKLPGSDPSFDLEDPDKVLRIESPSNGIKDRDIREIVHEHGYSMEGLL